MEMVTKTLTCQHIARSVPLRQRRIFTCISVGREVKVIFEHMEDEKVTMIDSSKRGPALYANDSEYVIESK